MKIEKINELFARFAGQLLKMRWITLGIFALVIILSVIGMKRMVKETSFDDYFIEDDPMLVTPSTTSCMPFWATTTFTLTAACSPSTRKTQSSGSS